MKRRLVIIAMLALVSALAFAAARPPAAHAAAPITTLTKAQLCDRLTRQDLRVLQSYVEEWTLDHAGTFPDTADVARGGALGALHAWPKNPWTNTAMQQGTARGDYDYDRIVAPVESYTLRARLSGSRWFTLTPTAFPGRLDQLRSELKDATTERNIRVLQGYVDQWSLRNNGVLPSQADLSALGAVGLAHDYWPSNPFTNIALATGPDPGAFTYAPGADGAYTLAGHETTGDYTVTATAPSLRAFLDSMRDRVVTLSVDRLAAAVDLYALYNQDTFPDQLDSLTLAQHYVQVDDWPVNPWTNEAMADNTSVGDFTYAGDTVSGGYAISGHLSDGSDYTVSRDWYEIQSSRVRASLKNYCARYGVQVIKDYVDAWKAAHGSLPTADQVSATGDVGLAHTWWPLNPFTNAPMQSGTPGDGGGYYQYVDNGDGTFSLSVGQLVIPQRTPSDPVWPPSYTAQ